MNVFRWIGHYAVWHELAGVGEEEVGATGVIEVEGGEVVDVGTVDDPEGFGGVVYERSRSIRFSIEKKEDGMV